MNCTQIKTHLLSFTLELSSSTSEKWKLIKTSIFHSLFDFKFSWNPKFISSDIENFFFPEIQVFWETTQRILYTFHKKVITQCVVCWHPVSTGAVVSCNSILSFSTLVTETLKIWKKSLNLSESHSKIPFKCPPPSAEKNPVPLGASRVACWVAAQAMCMQVSTTISWKMSLFLFPTEFLNFFPRLVLFSLFFCTEKL